MEYSKVSFDAYTRDGILLHVTLGIVHEISADSKKHIGVENSQHESLKDIIQLHTADYSRSLLVNYVFDEMLQGNSRTKFTQELISKLVTSLAPRGILIDKYGVGILSLIPDEAVISFMTKMAMEKKTNDVSIVLEIDDLIKMAQAISIESEPSKVFHSCFISYSSKDREFAMKLYTDLRREKVPVWIDLMNLKTGDRLFEVIDKAIGKSDKLILIFSTNSIYSDWVKNEIETTLALEIEQKRNVLVPIRIDNSIFETNEQWSLKIKRTRHIGDFSSWNDLNAYQIALKKLLNDLKKSVE